MKMCEMWVYCEIQVWSREYTKRFHRGFKYQSFRGIITAIDVSVKQSPSFCLSVRNCCSLKLMSGYGFYVLTLLPWPSNIYQISEAFFLFYLFHFFLFFGKICQHWHKKKHSFFNHIKQHYWISKHNCAASIFVTGWHSARMNQSKSWLWMWILQAVMAQIRTHTELTVNSCLKPLMSNIGWP